MLKDNVNFLDKRERLSEVIHRLQILVAMESEERGHEFENYDQFKFELKRATNLIDEMVD